MQSRTSSRRFSVNRINDVPPLLESHFNTVQKGQEIYREQPWPRSIHLPRIISTKLLSFRRNVRPAFAIGISPQWNNLAFNVCFWLLFIWHLTIGWGVGLSTLTQTNNTSDKIWFFGRNTFRRFSVFLRVTSSKLYCTPWFMADQVGTWFPFTQSGTNCE